MSTFTSQIPYELAMAYGREAVQIGESGRYTAPSGRTVDLRDQVEKARRGTVSHPADEAFSEYQPGNFSTEIEVVNETTLSAGKRLLEAGLHPAALNFASPTHPGGGFLEGARAQEEYLARSTGLYECIRSNPMYDLNTRHYSAFASDHIIYSPEVPVFRDDAGALLEEPWSIGILTAPAVQAKKVALGERQKIGPVMWNRMLKVLAAGLAHGHDSLVLGAWGCGAFGNRGDEVARMFARALNQNFKGAFQRVAFAIVDWSPEGKFIGPFRAVFQAG